MATTDRTNRVDVERRIRNIQEWILDDHAYSDIVRSVVNKWGIGERQAQRYVKQAYEAFKEKNEQSMEIKKAFYLSRKRKLLRDMDPEIKKTASGARAANKILDSMAELEGIKINRVEVTGKDGLPLEAGIMPAVIVLPSNGRENGDQDS